LSPVGACCFFMTCRVAGFHQASNLFLPNPVGWLWIQTEIDGGRIQGIDGLVQFNPQRVLRVESARARNEALREVRIDPPIAGPVGVGQRAMSDHRPKPHMIELVRARTKADFQVGQTLSIGNLSERHGEELFPTRETQNLVVSAVTNHAPTKLLGMNPRHDLGENCFSGMHSGSLAGSLLREMANWSSNRSHPIPFPSSVPPAGSTDSYSSWPDDSDPSSLIPV